MTNVALQHLEGKFDDLFHGSGRLVLEDGFDGLGNGGRWETKHSEGFAGFVVNFTVGDGGSSTFARWGNGFDTERNDLVTQFHDDALGGLGTQSFDGFQHALVAVHDEPCQFGGGEAAEHGAGGVATYATHADEQEEKFAFLLGGKAEEGPCVFADRLIDEESRFALALQGGVGVEGDIEKIAHTMCFEGGLGGGKFVEDTSDVFVGKDTNFK